MLRRERLQELARLSGGKDGEMVDSGALADWDSEEIADAEREGLLVLRGFGRSVRCHGCHKGCRVEPERVKYPDGRSAGVSVPPPSRVENSTSTGSSSASDRSTTDVSKTTSFVCTDGTGVKENAGEFNFKANIDAFVGNSGSPVVNVQTLQVEGILYGGNADFVRDGNCDRTSVCPDEGCPGWEAVTRTTAFADQVPSWDVYLGTAVDNMTLICADSPKPCRRVRLACSRHTTGRSSPKTNAARPPAPSGRSRADHGGPEPRLRRGHGRLCEARRAMAQCGLLGRIGCAAADRQLARKGQPIRHPPQ